jgi:competence protein ComEA
MTNRKRAARVLVTVFVLVFALTGFTVAADAPKININTASAEELTQLKRIGPKYADKIVAFRKANGPFKSAEELVNVTGIGPKTIEVNRDLITVK